jgi:hypothetical protein
MQFSGRGVGPIKALHAVPGGLSDVEMAESVARAIAPYGIDMVLHMIPPKELTEGTPTPLHFKLKEDPFTHHPLTHQMKPEILDKTGTHQEKHQQWAETAVANMRSNMLKDQPKSFTSHWMQDTVHFGPKSLVTQKISEINDAQKVAYASIAQHYGKPLLEQTPIAMDYGNIFLDIKKADGSRCHLVGESYLNKMKQYLVDKQIIEEKGDQLEEWANRILAKQLGVKAEEVIYLPEPNFHIDMMMTPLNYPNILVQDSQMCVQVLEAALADLKAKGRLSDAQHQEQNELQDLLTKTRKQEAYLTGNQYASMAQVIASLKKHGFNPIPAPLVYGHLEVDPNPDKSSSKTFSEAAEGKSDCVNLANAHVHEMSDGRLVMITMSSSRRTLNRLANQALLNCLPKGSELLMLSGGKGPKGYDGDAPKTYFEFGLNKDWGGFHCTFAEEMQPSFYAEA